MKQTLLLLLLSTRLVAADSAESEAASLYRRGDAEFKLEHYDGAIQLWQESLRLADLPLSHYNLAQAYRLRGRDGDCAKARGEYQAYLRGADASPDSNELRAHAEQFTQTECPKPVVPIERAGHSNLGSVSLGVGGMLLLASGIYLGHRASSRGDAVTSSCAVMCDWAVQGPRESAGRRDAKLGYTLDVVGLAAIGGSVVWYWLGRRETTIAPVGTRGAVVSWRSEW